MPNVILDRIPLPNLRLYTSVSVLLVSCCIYYAISSTSDPFWRFDNNSTAGDSFFSLSPNDIIAGLDGTGFDIEKVLDVGRSASNAAGAENVAGAAGDEMSNTLLQYISPDQRKLFNDTRTIGSKVKDVVSFMVQEPICIWVSVSLIFCVLLFVYLMKWLIESGIAIDVKAQSTCCVLCDDRFALVHGSVDDGVSNKFRRQTIFGETQSSRTTNEWIWLAWINHFPKYRCYCCYCCSHPIQSNNNWWICWIGNFSFRVVIDTTE